MRKTLLIALLASTALSAQQLPAGPGADVLKSRCVVCHESDIITTQQLSLAGWTRSIDKMVRWGSTITPAEREVLQPYLAEHFGPRLSERITAAVSHPGSGDGDAIYQRACLVCHGGDMIEQQKLSKAGWTRSVEKMMRWGASVTDAEKEPLVDYLARKYPPR